MAKRRLSRALYPSTRATSCTIVIILDLLKQVTPVFPVPGLSAVVDIATAILTRVENLQSLGIQFHLLAQSIGALILAIVTERSNTPNLSTSDEKSVDLLLRALNDINGFIHEQTARNWLYRFFHQTLITDKLMEYTEQLNSCCRAFQITSLIRVRNLLESERASRDSAEDLLHEIIRQLQMDSLATQSHQQRLSVELSDVSTRLMMLGKISQQNRDDSELHHKETLQAIRHINSEEDRECRIFLQGDVIATRVFQEQDHQNGSIYFAKLREDRKPVLIKRYKGELARGTYLKELRDLLDLWHPNLPQVLGHSAPSSQISFLVVTGVVTRDVAQYVKAQSEILSPELGFMTGLSMLQGVSSALEHLRSNCKLGKYELQDCAMVSNFFLNDEYRVVLGQNIVHNVPGPGPNSRDVLRLDQWIVDQFWLITETLLFGSAFDFTDWEVVTGRSVVPHMRALLRLSAWYHGQTFTSVARRINNLLDRLLTRQVSYGSLTWSQIRREFLETGGIKHCMFYRPGTHWDVQLYDIGFVRDGKFTKLCNVADQVDFALEYQKPLIYSSFPDVLPQVSILPCGTTRYAFDGPLFSGISKTAGGVQVERSAEPFRFMIDRSHTLFAEYGGQHPGLEIRDLIFIVGTNEHPRGATFEWHTLDERDQGPQFPVFFHEFPDVCEGRPWGFWSFDPTPVPVTNPLHPQVTVFTTSALQTIIFVQLENNDCTRITEV